MDRQLYFQLFHFKQQSKKSNDYAIFLCNYNMKNQRSQFHLFFVRQLKDEIDTQSLNLRDIIRTLKQSNPYLTNQELISEILNVIRNSEQGKRSIEKIQYQVKQKANSLHEYDSKKHTFMIDCLRESVSYPFINSEQSSYRNFQVCYKQNLSKQLRRVMWWNKLVNEQRKKQFYQVDHLITPYNVQLELITILNRKADEAGIKLKQNQIDLSIRLLEYFVKKNKKLPSQSQIWLVVCLADLYSYFTIKNILEIGAIMLGLQQITMISYQEDLLIRIDTILMVISLIDKQTQQLLASKYLNITNYDSKPFRQLNETFEKFRLSLAVNYLPLNGCYFLIDQLILKRKNKLDIYAFYAIMLMILTDQFEEQAKKQMPGSFSEIINRAKKIIRLQDVIDAFNVCYEKIPCTYDPRKMRKIPQTNKLFESMLEQQDQDSDIEDLQNEQNQPVQDDLVMQSNDVFRLGQKKKQQN